MIQTIKDIDLHGKRVLCRVDFNVPLENGEVLDDTRIVESLPTIRYILDQGGYVIIMSHLGRPKGPEDKFSLSPVAKHLANLIGEDVKFSSETVGDVPRKIISNLSPQGYRVVLLENTRFNSGETKNDPEFAKSLAELGDAFVSDAFGTAHRAHASTEGITHYIPGFAGFLMEKEYNRITNAISNPMKPAVAIVGGAKVSTKLSVLEKLVDVVDHIIIGGGMAFTFIKAKGGKIGKSLVEHEMLSEANKIFELAEIRNVDIHLPVDVKIALDFDTPILDENGIVKYISATTIPDDAMALDIGPQSEKLFDQIIKSANTIIWNGPMGVFEKDIYAQGTLSVVNAVFNRSVNTIVGGGDTIYAINKAGIKEIPDNIHLSTGGGASLELMSGKTLPGISCLIGKTL